MPVYQASSHVPSVRCVRCESASVQVVAPAVNYLLLIGAVLGGWALIRRQINAAVVLMVGMIAAAAFAKRLSSRRRCEACGHVWRHGSRRFRSTLHAQRKE